MNLEFFWNRRLWLFAVLLSGSSDSLLAAKVLSSKQNEIIEEDFGSQRNTPAISEPKKKTIKIAPDHSVQPQTPMPPAPDEPKDDSLPKNRPSSRRPPTVSEDQLPNGERDHAGDIDEEGDIGVGVGIGFGNRSFSGSLALTFPIYRWLAWSTDGYYQTWKQDADEEVKYGTELTLQARYQSRIPITPFIGAGAGYEWWARHRAEELFDDSSAPLSIYLAGVSIPMAKHLAIQISETWRTYLDHPPRKFEDDHRKREKYGSARFDVGLIVVF